MSGWVCNKWIKVGDLDFRCVRKNGHGRYEAYEGHRFELVERVDLEAVLEMREIAGRIIAASTVKP